MLRKNNWLLSLEIYQKRVFDGVYFSNFASLQCTDCKSAIHIIYHIFFSEYVPKTSFIKNNILRMSLWYTNELINLWPCSAQPVILPKREFILNLSEEALKISDISTRKTFFSVKFKVYIFAILMKIDSTTQIFLYGFCKTALFKFFLAFSTTYLGHSFLTKLQASTYRLQLRWNDVFWIYNV